MEITGWMFRAIVTPMFSVMAFWAFYQLSITGDGRWWLTILSAPAFGAMTFMLGGLLISSARRH